MFQTFSLIIFVEWAELDTVEEYLILIHVTLILFYFMFQTFSLILFVE